MGAPLFSDLVVNGEVVPRAAIAAEAQNHPAPPGKPGLAWRRAADALAIRTLLLQEARRRGLVAEPAPVGPGRFETAEEALIRALLDAAITVAPPTEAEIRAEWARDPARFRAPPLWEVSHILIACDPGDPAAADAARRRAEALCAALLADPDGFARLAAEQSDCPSRAAGGALGQIRPGDTVPEFEAALRDLEPGQITPRPVATRHGWHVIRLDAMAGGAQLPYHVARERIAAAMEKARWARAARDLVQALVQGAVITGADPGGRRAAAAGAR
ncbi:MAG: peptidylprolyl isomerase [Paracoccaceae bacterium]|nr:MAG: peptidylprolyl isomerase [Paracoccaceae bacterium]